MENEFDKVMTERSDEELIKIVTVERKNYQPLAVQSAESEIKKRKIDPTFFKTIRKKAQVEKEQKAMLNSNVVSSATRFVNFLIDFIVWLVISFMAIFICSLIIQTTNQAMATLISYTILIITFIAYYSIMEINFQKTIGKFVTKTKVVKMNGEKPSNADILGRTLCRLIPFDRISFLFVKNGIHDFLSKTNVVKDQIHKP